MPQNQIGANTHLSDDTQLGENVRIGNNVTVYPGVTIEDGCTIFDGAVIGRPPMATSSITRPIDQSARPLTIGQGSIIGANAVLYTGIQIGRNTLIGDLASIREDCVFGDEVVIGRNVLVMYGTTVGARTRVIDGSILTGNMVIETDVFIGPGVDTVNDNEVYLRRFGLAEFEVKGPTIRRFALIGTGANVAAGVEIGAGAIVAPSAMVTRDVEPWTIVAGVPARMIKPVAESDRARILQYFGLEDGDLEG